MSETETAARVTHEQALDANPDLSQKLGEFATNGDLDHDQAMQVANEDAASLERHVAAISTAEMPASHPNVDLVTITVKGLIEACSYYAGLAARDPELANSKAATAIQDMQEQESMRQKGMSEEEIKRQQLTARREKQEEKIRAKAEAAAQAKSAAKAEVAEPKPVETKPATIREDVEPVQPVVSERVKKDERELVEPPQETAPPEIIKPVLSKQVERLAAEQERAPALPRHDPEETEQTARLRVLEAYQAVEMPKRDVAKELIQPGALTQTEQYDSATDRPEYDEAPSLIDDDIPLNELEWGERLVQDNPMTEVERLALIEAALHGEDATSLPVHDLGVAAETATREPTLVSSTRLTTERAEPSIERLYAEPITWDVVSGKEPVELYDDFAQALHTLVTTAEVLPKNDTAEVVAEYANSQTAEIEPEPIPAIATRVFERLDNLGLAERVVIAPLLQDIVTSMPASVSIQAEVIVESEVMEATAAKLEAQVITFFGMLGIEYEPEDVEQFIQMLLRPDFQPLQPTSAAQADLEHEGTREAKIHLSLSQIADDLDDIEHELKQLLGKFVLFRTPGFLASRYVLAA